LVQGGFKRTDLNDTEQDSTTLAVSRYWDLSSGWQRAINLRWSIWRNDEFVATQDIRFEAGAVGAGNKSGGLMPCFTPEWIKRLG
ncbi:hypothetical protein MJN47_31485, partial [Salmonella enterica subsp. enterica serovar Lubbock]|nr:hypothetical protein [Salmonella enterica subsp. enterica serovar Lubbock]